MDIPCLLLRVRTRLVALRRGNIVEDANCRTSGGWPQIRGPDEWPSDHYIRMYTFAQAA